MVHISRRDFLKKSFLYLLSFAGGVGLGHLFLPKRLPFEELSMKYLPPYLQLQKSGELKKRGLALMERLRACDLCPRQCKVDRLGGKEGFCGASGQLEVSSYHPHFGEERPLVGDGGSGTIFLTNCSLRCVFCINYDVSHLGQGNVVSIEDMAAMMISLQEKGCKNINFVTPTHYIPHIVLAVDKAVDQGLHLPLVYNTCGWERLEILKELDGIIDIYLPDFKYWDSESAKKYSAGAASYPEITQKSILEMQKQVGIVKASLDGKLINRGLMIRHLIMPNDVCDSKQIIDWIANNLPRKTYVNLMSQYQPVYKAFEYQEIARRVTKQEYWDIVRYAEGIGLTNLEIQGEI